MFFTPQSLRDRVFGTRVFAANVMASLVVCGAACNKDRASEDVAPRQSTSWFRDITDETGITFAYTNGGRGELYMPEVMGSGTALFDYDNDGDLDVYFTNGHDNLPELDGDGATTNRLFRHESDGRFVDVTEDSGLGDAGYGMGVAIGDIDNDGNEDVFVTNLGKDRLYRSMGDGTFSDITNEAGVAVHGWSASACFFDYDADGFLDLFVSQYVDWNPTHKCSGVGSRLEFCGPQNFPAVPDVLFHNNGDGTFRDVTGAAGIGSVPPAAGLGVVCEDLNGDRKMDVFVANDAHSNHLWINQGDGTFREEAMEQGVAFNLRGRAEAGIGVIAADFDNGGDSDLFLTHLAHESNTLYGNDGPLGFNDETNERNVSLSSMPYTGFGTAAFDVELDGDLDLLVVNGRVKRVEELIPHAGVPPPWDILAEPNLFYVNDGTGRFEQVMEPVAELCDPVEISRGLAIGDIDGDGDVDFVISNILSAARVYRNEAPRHGAWLIVRAFDARWNRDAIGARVTVQVERRSYVRVITRAFSYLSSSDALAHFRLGDAVRADRILVEWPDGTCEAFADVPVNASVQLTRGMGTGRAAT